MGTAIETLIEADILSSLSNDQPITASQDSAYSINNAHHNIYVDYTLPSVGIPSQTGAIIALARDSEDALFLLDTLSELWMDEDFDDFSTFHSLK